MKEIRKCKNNIGLAFYSYGISCGSICAKVKASYKFNDKGTNMASVFLETAHDSFY